MGLWSRGNMALNSPLLQPQGQQVYGWASDRSPGCLVGRGGGLALPGSADWQTIEFQVSQAYHQL